MTKREQEILRTLLRVGHDLDGGQLDERLLHAQINLTLKPAASLQEFEALKRHAITEGWLQAVRGKLGGEKLSLTDLGEAAFQETR